QHGGHAREAVQEARILYRVLRREGADGFGCARLIVPEDERAAVARRRAGVRRRADNPQSMLHEAERSHQRRIDRRRVRQRRAAPPRRGASRTPLARLCVFCDSVVFFFVCFVSFVCFVFSGSLVTDHAFCPRMRSAQLRPGAPMMPPPGCVAEPHIQRLRTGVLYCAHPGTGRAKNSCSSVSSPWKILPSVKPNSRSRSSGVSTCRCRMMSRMLGACSAIVSITASPNASRRSSHVPEAS